MTDLPHIPHEVRSVLPPHFWGAQSTGAAPGRFPVRRDDPGRVVRSPGVVWDGVFDGWSGYAKLNHEIVNRVANHMYVEATHALRCAGDSGRDADHDLRIRAYQETRVAPTAPYVRAFGPNVEIMPLNRHRVIFTMMETEVVHPNMVDLINRFDECWAPTEWGVEAFRRSGVRLPCRQIPLGVSPLIYRPMEGMRLPACELVSTAASGRMHTPDGFVFITVGLPSVRKGFDILTDAFEAAFGDTDGVSLVCATTHAAPDTTLDRCRAMKSRIYVLRGGFDEHGMARIYNACDAYVSASRGEGWNLPLVEAAACGLPAIVPRHTSHPEVAGNAAFMFNAEGVAPLTGSETISKWYQGMPFPVLGKKSTAELTELLRVVASGDPQVKTRAAALREHVVSRWSWDTTAAIVTRRLLDLQP